MSSKDQSVTIYLKQSMELIAISPQSHKYRCKNWIVVEGVTKVTIDDEIKLVHVGHTVYPPKGEIHRMENPSKYVMDLIQFRVGKYQGEDFIAR